MLNLIDPFSTIPPVGLCAVVPAGIVRADVVFTLATLHVAGVSRILFPVVEAILLFDTVIASLILRELVVFRTPEVVIFPLEETN